MSIYLSIVIPAYNEAPILDQFLPQLLPDQLEAACHAVKQPIMLRQHPEYDHGYYFIQTVMADHLHHHAARL